jgi:hypothetical protein
MAIRAHITQDSGRSHAAGRGLPCLRSCAKLIASLSIFGVSAIAQNVATSLLPGQHLIDPMPSGVGAQWQKYSFFSSRTAFEAARLQKVSPGDSYALQQEFARERLLMPGSTFRAPSMPPEVGLESATRRLNELKAVEISSPATYAGWLGQVVPGGKWDLKTYVPPCDAFRLDYENAGNFLFGFSGRAIGNPKWFLDLGAGWVNQLQAAMRKNSKWFPYDGPFSKTWGDDPVDWVWSNMGMDYFNSSQHLLDFFDDPNNLPPGPLRDKAILRSSLRDDPWVEAGRRLAQSGLMNAEVIDRLREEMQRRQRQTQAKLAAERQRNEVERFMRLIMEDVLRRARDDEARKDAEYQAALRQRELERAAAEAERVRVEECKRQEEMLKAMEQAQRAQEEMSRRRAMDAARQKDWEYHLRYIRDEEERRRNTPQSTWNGSSTAPWSYSPSSGSGGYSPLSPERPSDSGVLP